MMDPDTPYGVVLLILGTILAASIAADAVAHRLGLPRISMLMILGVGFGSLQHSLLDDDVAATLDALGEPLVTIALVMVAFLLGGELTLTRLRSTAGLILVVSLTVVFVSVALVGGGLLMLGFPLTVALPLAAVSAATDPAAVHGVVRDSGATDSPLGHLLLGIVAIDDAWGIVVFGVTMAVLGLLVSGDGTSALVHGAWDLLGALTLGVAVGVPAALLTGRLRPGEPTQVEALAVVLCIAGLSAILGVSPLLAAMTAGVTVANLSVHHTRSFREIEHIEWPFLVFFFVLAGASLDVVQAAHSAPAVVAYMGLRVVGRLSGGWLGVRLGAAPAREAPPAIGLALTPQAGVAIGMALLAAEQYPEAAPTLVAVAVSSAVVFETVGPILTQRVLRPDRRA